MRRTLLAALGTALALGVIGCSEVSDREGGAMPTGPAGQTLIIPCGQPTTVTLWAGQFFDAGTVTVTNNADTLSVEIVAAANWQLTESHVAVAHTLADLPQTGSGNPQVGHFDFAAEHDPPVTTYTYTISMLDYGYQTGDPLVVAVHAAVERLNDQGAPVQQETAWADGLDFPGDNWATYVEYTVQECVEPVLCVLEVTYPNGGEWFSCGSDYITWTVTGEGCGDLVRIELLRNSIPCQVIADAAPITDDYYWQDITGCVPDSSLGYSVRVSALTGGAFDVSDATFEIWPCGGGGNE